MRYKNLANILSFYLCWWISIYGALNEQYFLGIITVSFYMVFHFIFLSTSYSEFYYIVICFFISFIPDSLLLNLGFISYKGSLPMNFNIAPFWALSLWLCFSLSIFHSFSFLKGNYLKASILGVISGPIIYYSCSKAGIIVFLINQYYALILISLIWSFLIPVYFHIADLIVRKYDN